VTGGQKTAVQIQGDFRPRDCRCSAISA